MATILLVMASAVCSVVVFNAVFPAVTGGSGAIREAAVKLEERVRSQISIIKVGTSGTDVYIWVKNIGSNQIRGIDRMDVFFGPPGNETRIAYGGNGYPRWDYLIENDSSFLPSATLKITIYNSSLPSGIYKVRVVTPAGVCDEETFSL